MEPACFFDSTSVPFYSRKRASFYSRISPRMKKTSIFFALAALLLVPVNALAVHNNPYGGGYGRGGYPAYQPRMPERGSSFVDVASCRQVGNDISVRLDSGSQYFLTSTVRDAGYGLRRYRMTCVSPTRYRVDWIEGTPRSPMPNPKQPPYNPPPASSVVRVSTVDDVFMPRTITIRAGTTVRWTNRGMHPHTVTADTHAFNSGTLSPGQTFSHVFTRPGTYRYYCIFHGAPGGIGMSGTVVVTD